MCFVNEAIGLSLWHIYTGLIIIMDRDVRIVIRIVDDIAKGRYENIVLKKIQIAKKCSPAKPDSSL